MIFEKINQNIFSPINNCTENKISIGNLSMKSRLQKTLYEKRYDLNKSLSLMKSNIPDSIVSPNVDRYSKVLSSMRSTFSNKMMENYPLKFTPKPFSETEI